MTGSFDKIYTRPIIVDEDKLRYLSEIMEELDADLHRSNSFFDKESLRVLVYWRLIPHRRPD